MRDEAEGPLYESPSIHRGVSHNPLLRFLTISSDMESRPAMFSSTGPPTASDWESRRPLITQLYRDEKKPLHQMMARVNDSGFRAR